MSKNLKKILVTGASLLMFASVGAGLNNVSGNHTANAKSYYQIDTGRIHHGVTLRGRYWPAGTRLYGGHAGSAFGGPRGSVLSYVGSPDGPQDFVPGWAMRSGRRHAKDSFSAWHEITRLFNSYGRGEYQSGNGQVAYINGNRIEIGTSISGAIVNGRHYTTDNSGLNAIRYAIRHPRYHHAKKHYRRVRKYNKNRVRKNHKRNHRAYRKSVVKHQRKRHHANKRSAMFKRYLKLSKHSHSAGIIMPKSSDGITPIPYYIAKQYIKNSRYSGAGANALNYASKEMSQVIKPRTLKSIISNPRVSKHTKEQARYKLSQYNTVEAEIKINLQEQGY